MTISENELKTIFESMTNDAINRKPVSYGPLGTFKAIVDLGDNWHNYKIIQRELQKKMKTGNIYSYKLAGLYPQILEVDGDKVRIKPDIFPMVKKVINDYTEKILKVKQDKK